MENSSPEEEYKALHETKFKGLWKIYGKWIFLVKRTFLYAFFLSALLTIIIACQSKSSHEVYKILDDHILLGIALEGGLIGLTLAGLTLMVTFGSETLMKQLVRDNINKALEKQEPPKYSIYQTAVSKFSFAVLVQTITLTVLFTVHIIGSINLSYDDQFYNELSNTLLILICLTLIFYSLFLVIQMTINIFTISQMNHMIYFEKEVDRLTSEKSKRHKNIKDNK